MIKTFTYCISSPYFAIWCILSAGQKVALNVLHFVHRTQHFYIKDTNTKHTYFWVQIMSNDTILMFRHLTRLLLANARSSLQSGKPAIGRHTWLLRIKNNILKVYLLIEIDVHDWHTNKLCFLSVSAFRLHIFITEYWTLITNICL